jgi:long-chain acyl-CoA synthetase
MLTHGNVVAAMRAMDVLPIEPGDVGFSFLPLAHVLQRSVDYRGAWTGVPGCVGRAIETVIDDLAVAQPTLMAAVPRIFEKVYAKIQEARGGPAGAERASSTGRSASASRSRSCVRRSGRSPRARGAAPPGHGAGLRQAARPPRRQGALFVTGGAPIAVEILEFFDAAEHPDRRGLGHDRDLRRGSLNLPGRREVRHHRQADARHRAQARRRRRDPGARGERLLRLLQGPEATRAAFTDDGWFRTGDIARIDEDGYFKIVDRKKDL